MSDPAPFTVIDPSTAPVAADDTPEPTVPKSGQFILTLTERLALEQVLRLKNRADTVAGQVLGDIRATHGFDESTTVRIIDLKSGQAAWQQQE